MPRRLPPRALGALLALVPILGVLPVAGAQEALRITEPVANRVYQRDRNDRATITVEIENPFQGAKLRSVLIGPDNNPVEGVILDDGALRDVPTGGPFKLVCEAISADGTQVLREV